MSLESTVDIIIQFWSVLWDFKIFNISIVIWASIPLVIGLIMSFVKGNKE